MKTLFVLLLIVTLPVSASDDIDDALEILRPESEQSGLENNASIAEAETKAADEAREKTKRSFAWHGVGMVVSGVALMAVGGSEAITGNDAPITTGAWIQGIGTGMTFSGCVVAWKALPSKKSKK